MLSNNSTWLTALPQTRATSTDYGPYNTLLTKVFPSTEHYQVAPQFKRVTGSMDFTVLYIVSKRKVPVLFIEIKTFLALQHDSTRAQADEQMRNRYRDFITGSMPLHKLIGISAMGPRFAVYEYWPETRRLLPPAIMPQNPEILADTAPEVRWQYDILEDAGEAKFMELVSDIKDMSNALAGNCEWLGSLFR